MAKKKIKDVAAEVDKAGKIVQKNTTATPGTKLGSGVQAPFYASTKGQLLLAGAIGVITFLFLMVCIDNQFTNWDDPGYIKDNQVIKSLSGEGLSAIFSTSIMGNYHPLTILTYAIEYSCVNLEPWLYHLDSLLFHVIVTLLVYWFVQALTKRPVAAAVAAILFGLHPMHVESVAWVAGRKDVVYGTFYIAACIAYLYYVRALEKTKPIGLYLFVFILFVCSLLAKPVAVVLPVTLLLIDIFEGRLFKSPELEGNNEPLSVRKLDFNFNALLDKIPFFAASVAFGIKSVKDQQAFGSLDTMNVDFNHIERIGLGGYALVTYLWKAVAPVGLSNFYPYPEKTVLGIHWHYYLYPLVFVGLLFAIWRFGRKNKVVLFGSLFFLVNIVLLLQFIPVGGAIVADRYSYIPYLGLFIMAGWGIATVLEDAAYHKYKTVALAGIVVYSLALGVLSNQRAKVWYDAMSLWRDEIEKEPVRAPNAYNNLGFNYFNKFNESVNPAEKRLYYDSAFYLLNRAIDLQPTFVNPHISLGELERSAGKFGEAKRHYYRALQLKGFDESANAYLGLAIIYAITRNGDSAAFCFKNALELKPYFPEAHSNYGNFLDMTRQPDAALQQYGIAIGQNPDMYAPYLNRGRLYQRLHKCDEAMKDFEKAISLNPNNGEAFFARAFCHAQRGNKQLAVADIEKAMSLGFTLSADGQKFYAAMKGG